MLVFVRSFLLFFCVFSYTNESALASAATSAQATTHSQSEEEGWLRTVLSMSVDGARGYREQPGAAALFGSRNPKYNRFELTQDALRIRGTNRDSYREFSEASKSALMKTVCTMEQQHPQEARALFPTQSLSLELYNTFERGEMSYNKYMLSFMRALRIGGAMSDMEYAFLRNEGIRSHMGEFVSVLEWLQSGDVSADSFNDLILAGQSDAGDDDHIMISYPCVDKTFLSFMEITAGMCVGIHPVAVPISPDFLARGGAPHGLLQTRLGFMMHDIFHAYLVSLHFKNSRFTQIMSGTEQGRARAEELEMAIAREEQFSSFLTDIVRERDIVRYEQNMARSAIIYQQNVDALNFNFRKSQERHQAQYAALTTISNSAAADAGNGHAIPLPTVEYCSMEAPENALTAAHFTSADEEGGASSGDTITPQDHKTVALKRLETERDELHSRIFSQNLHVFRAGLRAHVLNILKDQTLSLQQKRESIIPLFYMLHEFGAGQEVASDVLVYSEFPEQMRALVRTTSNRAQHYPLFQNSPRIQDILVAANLPENTNMNSLRISICHSADGFVMSSQRDSGLAVAATAATASAVEERVLRKILTEEEFFTLFPTIRQSSLLLEGGSRSVSEFLRAKEDAFLEITFENGDPDGLGVVESIVRETTSVYCASHWGDNNPVQIGATTHTYYGEEILRGNRAEMACNLASFTSVQSHTLGNNPAALGAAWSEVFHRSLRG